MIGRSLRAALSFGLVGFHDGGAIARHCLLGAGLRPRQAGRVGRTLGRSAVADRIVAYRVPIRSLFWCSGQRDILFEDVFQADGLYEAIRVVFNRDELGKNLAIANGSGTAIGPNAKSQSRQSLVQFFVALVFVAQAAA